MITYIYVGNIAARQYIENTALGNGSDDGKSEHTRVQLWFHAWLSETKPLGEMVNSEYYVYMCMFLCNQHDAASMDLTWFGWWDCFVGTFTYIPLTQKTY